MSAGRARQVGTMHLFASSRYSELMIHAYTHNAAFKAAVDHVEKVILPALLEGLLVQAQSQEQEIQRRLAEELTKPIENFDFRLIPHDYIPGVLESDGCRLCPHPRTDPIHDRSIQ